MNDVKKQTNSHYGALDGLRAYSAIGVAMMHILINGQYKVSGFVFDTFIKSLGNLVFLFMMISAFSMCCGYYSKILNCEISIEKFYGRRYQKMWPFFAILCVVDIIISPSRSAIYELFANLTLCFGLLPNANISVIGIGWFLGLIFVFYMIFPFFCYLISSRKRAWFVMIVSMLYHLVCRVYFFDSNHVINGFDVRGNILYSAMFFVFGGVLFLYKNLISDIAKRYRWCLIILSVATTGVYFYEGNSEPFIMLILFGLLLIYSIGNSGRKGFILQNSFTRFIGNISLEIYLCHMLFYRVMEKLNLNHMFENEILSYFCTVILTLVSAVIFSCIVKNIFRKIDDYKMKIIERE